jgi:hypothetical protein
MTIMRSIQSIVVIVLVTSLLFSPLLTLIVIIILARSCSLSIVLTFITIYACWMFIDRHTDSHGGRWSKRLRQWTLWSLFTEYFPMKLIKSEDLDCQRNYIFAYHPHGLLSLGAVGNFATDATHCSVYFPRIRPHLMLLRLQFYFPFTRDLWLGLGACCVSQTSCAYLLDGSAGQGNALVIVVGGIREMKLTRDETMILYLRERKGFIRLALQHGSVIFMDINDDYVRDYL